MNSLIRHYETTIIPGAKDNLAEAKRVVTRAKIEAVRAISHADDTAERVLTITADIRLLGILLALAGRLDSIARATREKLAELERKLI